jgi:hypothetical protein
MPLIAYHAVRLARQALELRRIQKAEDARGYTPEMAEAVMLAVQAKHDAVLAEHGVHAFVQRLAMPGKADGGPEDFRRCARCGQWSSSTPRGVHREPTDAERAEAAAARERFLADQIAKHGVHDFVTERATDSRCSRCGWSKYDQFIHSGAEAATAARQAATAARQAEREQELADLLAKHGVHDYDMDHDNWCRCRVCGQDKSKSAAFLHRGDAT